VRLLLGRGDLSHDEPDEVGLTPLVMAGDAMLNANSELKERMRCL